MTISRAQMRRQLYMGGGIASLEPRQQYGLGSIVKSVKKAVKGVGDAVGDIVSSDAGKLALLAAGAYYAPAMFGGTTGFGAGTTYGNFFRNVGAGLGMGNINPATTLNPSAYKLGSFLSSATGKGAAILGGSALLTSLFGSPDQAQEAFNRDPGYVKSALAKYYRNINKNREGEEGFDEEVQEFVNQNILEFGDVSRSDVVSGYEKNIQSNLDNAMYAAEGGRVGLAEGGLGNINTFAIYQNYLNEIQDAQANQQYNSLYNPTVSFQTSDGDSETQTVTSNPVASAFNPTMMDMATFAINPALGIANLASRNKTGLSLAQRAMDAFGISRGPFGRTAGFGVDSMAGMASGPTHGVDAVNEGSVSADASAGGAAGAAAASAAGSNDGPGGGTFAYGGRVMKGIGGLITQMINNNPEIFKRLQMASPVKQMQLQYMRNINPQMTEEETEEYIRENAAYGGPMGEPRMNQGGVPELDYRQEGGFVPVGIKEKADDVPAMLSKNEFVMTADAVRGMGNGSIENGAQKMYNLMKSLENRIA